MINCTVCGYDKNPEGSEFCDACGAELQNAVTESTDTVTIEPPIIKKPVEPPILKRPPKSETVEETVITATPEPETPIPIVSEPTTPPPMPHTPQPIGMTAQLIAKQPNAPVSEFPIENNVLIGIFDPDMGPVDIDLEDFAGNETVSRHHAEIYQDAGVWKIKDLGSTNGVFIKPMGQTRFGARITVPESLNSGDEVAIAKIRFLFQLT